jgi:precorrin-2 dehydrogenase/sirohydrochlorin ferrochelatase
MRYLPIELDVRGREALVVGSGREVGAKVDRLLAAGAVVTVIAPGELDPALDERAARGEIRVLRRRFEDGDAEGKAVVFVAPEEEALGRRLHAEAARTGRLVCTLDRPEASTFANAAVVSVSGLTMTFGTGGASPAAARRIREDLEALFADPRLGRFLEAMGRLRAALPRGERSTRMAEAVRGFAIEATLRFPPWFERGDQP